MNTVVLKADPGSKLQLNLDNVFLYNRAFSRLFQLLRLIDIQDLIPIPDVISQFVYNISVELPSLLEFDQHSDSVRTEFFDNGEQGVQAEFKVLQKLLVDFTTFLYDQQNPFQGPPSSSSSLQPQPQPGPMREIPLSKISQTPQQQQQQLISETPSHAHHPNPASI